MEKVKLSVEEVDSLIKETSPKWLLTEMDDMIELSKNEEWEAPIISYVDYLYTFALSDTLDSRRGRMALTKIEKKLGILVQVKEDDHIIEFSSGGRQRLLKAGEWTSSDLRWYDFLPAAED